MSNEAKETREEIQAEMKKARFDQPLVSSEEKQAQREAMLNHSTSESPEKSQPSKSGQLNPTS